MYGGAGTNCRDMISNLNFGSSISFYLSNSRYDQPSMSTSQECREELGPGFMSGSIDFWTDGHRREDFGVFCVTLIGKRYELEDGLSLFMSRNT